MDLTPNGLSDRKSSRLSRMLLDQRLDIDLLYRWPPMMYTEEGRRLGERLWDETMAELRFAEIEELLKGLKE